MRSKQRRRTVSSTAVLKVPRSKRRLKTRLFEEALNRDDRNKVKLKTMNLEINKAND